MYAEVIGVILILLCVCFHITGVSQESMDESMVSGLQKISETTGNIFASVTLDNDDKFGSAVTAVGDINGDSVIDLAIGAPSDTGNGAVYVIFLNSAADGTVDSYQRISASEGRSMFILWPTHHHSHPCHSLP